MPYRIEISSGAGRDLKRLSAGVLARVRERMLSLAGEPYPPGSRKLAGRQDSYRIRVGDYRIIYEILRSRNLIVITRILRRSETTYRQPG